MSFSLTTWQMYTGEKRVTRRQGWAKLAPGDVIAAVEKAQGLKRGEQIKRIRPIRVLSVSEEPIQNITLCELRLEGIGGYTPAQFVEMYCEANKCEPDDLCRRIEFDPMPPFYLESKPNFLRVTAFWEEDKGPTPIQFPQLDVANEDQHSRLLVFSPQAKALFERYKLNSI